MAKVKQVKKKPKLISLSYRCPKDSKRVTIKPDEFSFNYRTQECSTCSGHGSLELIISKCQACGKRHEIELDSY